MENLFMALHIRIWYICWNVELLFNAKIDKNVAIGVSSTITGGVEVPDNKFVPPGSVITTQEQLDNLPSTIGSPYENINEEVVHINEKLGKG